MPAYAYPIKIRKNKQWFYFDEIHELESNLLTLEALQFVGNDAFSICPPAEGFNSGYVINVSRSRLETDEERDALCKVQGRCG